MSTLRNDCRQDGRSSWWQTVARRYPMTRPPHRRAVRWTMGDVEDYQRADGQLPPWTPPPISAAVAPQMTLLELRSLTFQLPMPLSVNEAWHHVPYHDPLDRKRPLKVRIVLTDEHRHFRSRVISLVRRQMKTAPPLVGRIEMLLQLYFSNFRECDVDNRIKPLQDALTHAQAYRDDCLIDRECVERIIITNEEFCVVNLKEIAT